MRIRIDEISRCEMLTLLATPISASFTQLVISFFENSVLKLNFGPTATKSTISSGISVDDNVHAKNIKLAEKILLLNGYPMNFIQKHIRKRLIKHKTPHFRENKSQRHNNDINQRYVCHIKMYIQRNKKNPE